MTACDDRRGYAFLRGFGSLGDAIIGVWVCDASASDEDYRIIGL